MKYKLEVSIYDDNGKGYDYIYFQEFDNLDLQAVIAVVNGLEKPYVAGSARKWLREEWEPLGGSAERLLKICNCGHTRMYHVLAGGEKCERCDCQGFNEAPSQPDPNPLDKANYKDGA